MKKYGLWVFALPVALVLSTLYLLLQFGSVLPLWFIPPIDLALRGLWGVSWLVALPSLAINLTRLMNKVARFSDESDGDSISPLPFQLALGTLTLMVLFPVGFFTFLTMFLFAPFDYYRSEDGRQYTINDTSVGSSTYNVRGGIFRETEETLGPYASLNPVDPNQPSNGTEGSEPDYSSYLVERASNSSGDYAVLQPGYVSVAEFDGKGVPQNLYTFVEAGEAEPDYFAAHDPDTLVLSLATARSATPYLSVDGGYTWASLPSSILAEFPEPARFTLDSKVKGQTIRLLLGYPSWSDATLKGDEGASAWVISQDAGATWALEDQAVNQ